MPQYVNPKLRVKILKAETIEARPIKEGNMFFDQQNGELYFDLESQRVVIGRPKWSKISLDSNLPGGGDDPSDEGGVISPGPFNIDGYTGSVTTSEEGEYHLITYTFDEVINTDNFWFSGTYDKEPDKIAVTYESGATTDNIPNGPFSSINPFFNETTFSVGTIGDGLKQITFYSTTSEIISVTSLTTRMRPPVRD